MSRIAVAIAVVAAGRSHLAKRRGSESRVRIVVVRRVGEVEGVCAELKPETFSNRKRPGQGSVQIDHPRARQDIAADVAKRIGWRRGKLGRVEPQDAGADIAVDRRRTRTRQIRAIVDEWRIQTGVAEGDAERKSALRRENSARLPAAKQGRT